MKGTYQVTGGDWGEFKTDVVASSQFDIDARRFRFSRSEYAMVYDDGVSVASGDSGVEGLRCSPSSGIDKKGKQWFARISGGEVVTTPENDMLWNMSSPVIEIRPPESIRSTAVKPFDVRALGLTLMLDLERRQTFESMIAVVERFKTYRTTEENGMIVLTDLSAATRVETAWTFNPEQDYSPVSIVRRRMRGTDEGSIVSRADTTWEVENGVWVPVSCVLTDSQLKGATRELQLTLEWASVNAPIDASVFTAQSLTVPAETRILDSSIGTGIDLGPVKDELRQEFVPTASAPAGSRFVSRALIIGANLVVIACIVIVVVQRRRRSGSR